MTGEHVPEALLARIWNDGLIASELRTTAGDRVVVVYRGVWTHSNGPDFRDAMIEIAGRLVTGAVELHVRSSDWRAHGHHLNPTYDDVCLHVVLEDDAPDSCAGPGGAPVPTVFATPFLSSPIDVIRNDLPVLDLGHLGRDACLPTQAGNRVHDIHAVLRREGWRRMNGKQLRLQQELSIHPPGEVLYRSILDSLGLTANRSGMEVVADEMPLDALERIGKNEGFPGTLSALLGVAGFLPLSQSQVLLMDGTGVSAAEIEHQWNRFSEGEGTRRNRNPEWNLNRVRPQNHPVRRLGSLASLVASSAHEGLLPSLLSMPIDGGKSWDAWLAQSVPQIGEARRRQILVNSIAPFLAAFAETTGNFELLDAAHDTWEQLPGVVDDQIARSTVRQIVGTQRFPVRHALEVQGLHQIGREGCAMLRCFECPIAALAVLHEPVTVTR